MVLLGKLADLPVVLERASESLQAAVATLGTFVARLDDSRSILAETPVTQLESSQLPAVVAQLLAELATAATQTAVELWLDTTSVTRADSEKTA